MADCYRWNNESWRVNIFVVVVGREIGFGGGLEWWFLHLMTILLSVSFKQYLYDFLIICFRKPFHVKNILWLLLSINLFAHLDFLLLIILNIIIKRWELIVVQVFIYKIILPLAKHSNIHLILFILLIKKSTLFIIFRDYNYISIMEMQNM